MNVRFRIKGTQLYYDERTGGFLPLSSQSSPRAHWGSGSAGQSAYEAAGNGPRLAQWRPGARGPNSVLADRTTLVNRSRDAVRNNGMADSAVSGLTSNIVSTGIAPQFRTPDAAFNEELAEAFAEWTDESDVDERLDFYGQQALAARSMIEGGECFARLRIRGLEDGLSVPLQVQLLESEFCPDSKNETTASGEIVNGVEFDASGRRVAYWLYRSHPGEVLMRRPIDAQAMRVPASEIAQLSLLRRPGQVRGEPWLARALVKLRDVDTYDDAQLIRQQIAALFAGFVSDDGESDAPVFAGEAAPDGDGLALAPLEPGTMQKLRPGETINFSEPPSPGDSYASFMRQQWLSVAASAGALYEMVTGDYSNLNDRTWRAAVNEFRRRCETWQHHLVVFQFCRPVLQRWSQLAVLSGRVRPPAGITAAMIGRAEWLPVPWPYINPVQDVQAQRDAVRDGFKSRSQVVSEQGYDVARLDRETAADNARADELGLVYDTDPRRTTRAGGIAGAAPDPDEAAGNGNSNNSGGGNAE